MPGISRCFLPITELFPAEKRTDLLIQSKKRSATSPVVGWRPVQTASQPSSRRQRFDVCSKFPKLYCDHADHGKNADWCTIQCLCVRATNAESHAKAPTNLSNHFVFDTLIFWEGFQSFKFRWHTAPDFAEEYFWNLGLQHMRMRL